MRAAVSQSVSRPDSLDGLLIC